MTLDAKTGCLYFETGDTLDAFGAKVSITQTKPASYELHEIGETCDLKWWDEKAEVWRECYYAYDLPSSSPHYGKLYAQHT